MAPVAGFHASRYPVRNHSTISFPWRFRCLSGPATAAEGLHQEAGDIQRLASAHPRCGVTDTARPNCYLRTNRAACRPPRAGPTRGLRASCAARGYVCSMAPRCECAGRNQHSVGPRHESTTPAGARRYPFRLTRPDTSRFLSMAATAGARDPRLIKRTERG